jgi:hypothetical protein
VLGIKGSSNCIRQVAITCRRGISVVKNLKFLTPFFLNNKIKYYYTIYEL